MADDRALPTPTPETEHYWKGAREGKLLLQKCESCTKAYFPPRPFCPACGSRDVAVVQSSGRASLYSYAIHHRSVPGFKAPYAIAVVTLEEGPRMMTNILDCSQTPEALLSCWSSNLLVCSAGTLVSIITLAPALAFGMPATMTRSEDVKPELKTRKREANFSSRQLAFSDQPPNRPWIAALLCVGLSPRPFSLAPNSEPGGEGKRNSRHDQRKKSGTAQRTAAPPRFQPRPPSPKISWPVAVTAIVSSSMIKPRFGCFIVVSTETTMPASSGRSAS